MAEYRLANLIMKDDIDRVSQIFYDDEDKQFDLKHQINFIKQEIYFNDDKVFLATITFIRDGAQYSLEMPIDKNIWQDDKLIERALTDELNEEPSPVYRLLIEQMINELHALNDDGSSFNSEVFSFFRENILSQVGLWFVNKKDNTLQRSLPLSEDEVALLKLIDEETDNTLTGDSFIEEMLPQLWLKLNKKYGRWIYDEPEDEPIHPGIKAARLHREVTFNHLMNNLTKLARSGTTLIGGTGLVIKRFDSND